MGKGLWDWERDNDEGGVDHGIGKETIMKGSGFFWDQERDYDEGGMDYGIERETMMKRECIMGVTGGR